MYAYTPTFWKFRPSKLTASSIITKQAQSRSGRVCKHNKVGSSAVSTLEMSSGIIISIKSVHQELNGMGKIFYGLVPYCVLHSGFI